MNSVRLFLAKTVDVIHFGLVAPAMVAIIAYRVMGRAQRIKTLCTACILAILALQTAFLRCPLTTLSVRLSPLVRSGSDPYSRSITHVIYGRLQPLGALRWWLSALFSLVSAYYFRKLRR